MNSKEKPVVSLQILLAFPYHVIASCAIKPEEICMRKIRPNIHRHEAVKKERKQQLLHIKVYRNEG